MSKRTWQIPKRAEWSLQMFTIRRRHKPSYRNRHRGLSFEMMESRRMLHAAGLVGNDDGAAAEHGGELADFQLLDVNSTSPTNGQPVSPRDYLNQVSVWLFGWAT